MYPTIAGLLVETKTCVADISLRWGGARLASLLPNERIKLGLFSTRKGTAIMRWVQWLHTIPIWDY